MIGAAGNEALGPERALALAYVPKAVRDDLAAVWHLDARMRGIFVDAREPALAEIKLAWWQERLLDLRAGEGPAEPLLRSLSHATMLRNDHETLSHLAESWRELSGNEGDAADAMQAYAKKRGCASLRLTARLLGQEPDAWMFVAARAAALADLAQIALTAAMRSQARAEAQALYRAAGKRIWPRPLRPYGMLVETARRDAAASLVPRQGSPSRIARMAWHAMSGR